MERGEMSRHEGTVKRQEEGREKTGYEMDAGKEETGAPYECNHPKQYADNPVVQKFFWCNDGTNINRRWLAYCQERDALLSPDLIALRS